VASPKQQRIDPKRVPVPPKAKAGSGKSGRPGGRPQAAAVAKKATVGDWISGARLRTLPLGIAPVLLGTGAARIIGDDGGWHWVRALLALAVAVCLQIGVNYANDYSDGVRGTDNHRVGPARLTGSGAARPRTVLTVALAFFALAAVAGLILVILTGFYWLLIVGAAAIVAGYFYTGGKRPYGYNALGEVFVFVFFGLVATAGTTYVQEGSVNTESWLSGVAIGFIACAVLMVNNIRDIDQDRLAGKRTLAVVLGNRAARIVFVVFLLLPYLVLGFFVIFYPNAYLVFFSLLLALPTAAIALFAKTPPELILALKLSSLLALIYGLGLGAVFAF
jgi:1,4-dihydroxy-2-naphthoate octaprenyltransferase